MGAQPPAGGVGRGGAPSISFQMIRKKTPEALHAPLSSSETPLLASFTPFFKFLPVSRKLRALEASQASLEAPSEAPLEAPFKGLEDP